MKLIKKDQAVILKGYDIKELKKEIQQEIILNFRIEVYDFQTAKEWSDKRIIENITANDYLFTENGNLIPLLYKEGQKEQAQLKLFNPFKSVNNDHKITVKIEGAGKNE